MQVKVSHPYPLTADELLEFFFNEQSIQEKNQRLGAENLALTTEKFSNGQGKIHISRDVKPNSDVPKALKALQKPVNRVHQTESWSAGLNGDFHCEYTVNIDGVPAKLDGKMHIEAQGGESVIHVELTINCKVPLLGKVISQFIAKDSEMQMEAEYQINQALLKHSA